MDHRAVGVAQIVGGELEQLRCRRRGVAPPAVEVLAGHDVRGNAPVVEVVHGVVIEEVAAADPVLQRSDLGHEVPVTFEEAMLGVPLAEDEGVADEQLTRQCLVDAVVADRPAGDDRQPVQGHRLGGDGAAGAAVPAWLAVGAPDEVGAEALGPLRLHRRDAACPHPAGLHQLGRHHPPGWLLRQHRPRCDDERRAAGAAELPRVAISEAEVRQQPGEHRLVDVVGMAGARTSANTEVAGDLAELAEQVLPLAHA